MVVLVVGSSQNKVADALLELDAELELELELELEAELEQRKKERAAAVRKLNSPIKQDGQQNQDTRDDEEADKNERLRQIGLAQGMVDFVK